MNMPAEHCDLLQPKPEPPNQPDDPDDVNIDPLAASASAVFVQFAHHSGLFEPKIEPTAVVEREPSDSPDDHHETHSDPLAASSPEPDDHPMGTHSSFPIGCQQTHRTEAEEEEEEAEAEGQQHFSCAQCSMAFPTRRALLEHRKQHTPQTQPRRPFSCPHCARCFAFRAVLRNHLRTHTGETPFLCPRCPRSFALAGTLRIHERTHTGARPFRCDLCPERFTTDSNLRRHQLRHGCSVCAQRFADIKERLRHERRHEAVTVKPFGCDLCAELFQTDSSLRRHMLRHSCTICAQQFGGLKERLRHERSHEATKVKPFSCAQCGKGFALAVTLRTHRRTVHRDRDECGVRGAEEEPAESTDDSGERLRSGHSTSDSPELREPEATDIGDPLGPSDSAVHDMLTPKLELPEPSEPNLLHPAESTNTIVPPTPSIYEVHSQSGQNYVETMVKIEPEEQKRQAASN